MSKDPQHPSSEYDNYPYGEDPYGEPVIPYSRPDEPVNTPPPEETNRSLVSQYPYGDQQGGPASRSQEAGDAGQIVTGVNNDYRYNELSDAMPLPLGEAIRQLPGQYLHMLIKPSAQKFAQEKGKASWDIVWMQLLGLGIIVAIIEYLTSLINPTPIPPAMSSQYQLTPAAYQAINAGTSIAMILVIPLSFFIGVGILHLFAKMVRGQGSFLQYSYSILLFAVPLHTLANLFQLIPIPATGPDLYLLVSFIAIIYEIVLCIFATRAVHRLSGARASIAVLIPVFIALLCVCAFTALVSSAILATGS